MEICGTMLDSSYNWLYPDVLNGNRIYTIQAFQKILSEMEKTYGSNAILAFDAGHSNVEIAIYPEMKKDPSIKAISAMFRWAERSRDKN